MTNFFINILRWKLRILSRLTIWRYEPKIIGVTGSVGKTSTKVAVATVLRAEHRVRIAEGNLNNELGMPLTILGDWTPAELKLISRDTPAGTAPVRKILFWVKVLSTSAWRIISKSAEYPEVLVLEYGADRPGDIKELLRIVRPTIGIITAVGDVPVHVEYYAGPQEVAREKGRLIDSLPTTGFAVLGADDDAVMRLKDRTRAKVMTYGFHQGADLRISRFENQVKDQRPIGISFKIEFGGSIVPVRINGVFGKAHALAAGAASAVGLIFGMNLVRISEALEGYVSASSRMQMVPGIKRTLVIDDAYNASPLSMRSALETLADLPATRKVAVLGDMLEIGKYTAEVHEQIGHLAAETVDLLVAVGPRAKFIADGAREMGMKKGAVDCFDTAEEAKQSIKDMLRPGDLVLVKGSHAMQLDKVVSEIREVVVPAETISNS